MIRFRLTLLPLLVLITASLALAQERTFKFTGDDSLLTFMPELKTAPAPDWVKPGTRLVYYSAAAVVPVGTIGKLVPSPGHYGLKDPSGRYWNIVEATGPAGDGYTQLDIVSVQDDVVTVAITSYGFNGMGAELHVMDVKGASSRPGYFGDWWVNPAVLKKHDQFEMPGVRSALWPYELGGKKLDGVWLNTETNGGHTCTITESQTGRLLHSSMATEEKGHNIKINGVLTPVGAGAGYALSTLREVRQLQIPWAGTPLPASVANIRAVSFAGEITTTVPGSPPLPIAFDGVIKVTGKGVDFLQLSRETYAMQFGQRVLVEAPVNVVSGSSQLTPLAIPPEHLARLKTGQILDTDPVTKIVTAVQSIGPDDAGHQCVIIRQSQGAATDTFDYCYDRTTGLLMGVSEDNPAAFMRVRQRVTKVE